MNEDEDENENVDELVNEDEDENENENVDELVNDDEDEDENENEDVNGSSCPPTAGRCRAASTRSTLG